jgi:hypothetical protein
MMLVRHSRVDAPPDVLVRFSAITWAKSQSRVVGICIGHGDHGHLLDWLDARIAVASWFACRHLRRDMKRVLG